MYKEQHENNVTKIKHAQWTCSQNIQLKVKILNHVKVTCYNTKTLKIDMLQCNASTKELKTKVTKP